MNVDCLVHALAGTFVLASLLLARFVDPRFLWFGVFVGANLLQSAFTKWCLLASILRRLGVPDASPCLTAGAVRKAGV